MTTDYGGWEIHVVPIADTFMHVPTPYCWCNPEVNKDGTVIHHADDNREAFERGERKPT
jgi:hypothetical protein